MRNVREYHRPQQLDEALELLARSDVTSVPISGGSDLIADAPRDVEAVVDLQDLNLSYIRKEADALHIGATTTLQEMLDTSDVAKAWGGRLHAVLAYAAARNLREAGSIAGTLVTAESNHPLAVLLLALDASLVIVNRRQQPPRTLESSCTLVEFFADRGSALHNALIREVLIPLPHAGERVAFEKVSRTPADLPIVCVAARARVDNATLRDVRVAVGGAGARPLRIEAIEQTLEGHAWDTQTLEPSALALIETISNFMGSAKYRREMTLVLLQRTLKQLS